MEWAFTALKVFAAGLWPIIWHTFGYFALCLIGIAWGIWGPFKRSWGFAAAFFWAALLFTYSTAVYNMTLRCKMQIVELQKAAVASATAAGERGARDADSNRHDPQDTDKP